MFAFTKRCRAPRFTACLFTEKEAAHTKEAIVTTTLEKPRSFSSLPWGSLDAATSGDLFLPENPRYDEARRVWNGMIDRRPAAIARARTTEYVVAACGSRRSGWPGLRAVSATSRRFEDPVGEVLDGFRLPNGLAVRKVRVPLGVVAVVYESRPNVTIDCSALCLKSGNAMVCAGRRWRRTRTRCSRSLRVKRLRQPACPPGRSRSCPRRARGDARARDAGGKWWTC